MKIEDLIVVERVSCDNSSGSKKKALEALSALLVTDASDMSQDKIFESLISRERLGSTGLGHGVALPHARLSGHEQAIGAFIKLDKGVDFDAIDNKPTDLLFSLLVPDQSTDEHLNILAQLAQLFSDEKFCQSLRNSQSADQIYKLLTNQKNSSSV